MFSFNLTEQRPVLYCDICKQELELDEAIAVWEEFGEPVLFVHQLDWCGLSSKEQGYKYWDYARSIIAHLVAEMTTL